MRTIKFSAVIFLLSLGLGACTPHQQYQSKVNLCINQTPAAINSCESYSLQKFQEANQNYLLGFVEFDDQGIIFDRKQLEVLINTIYEESIDNDLLITVFMHGWQHSAASNDDNIATFRSLLTRLNELENQLSAINQETPRRVVGVYLGWRGRSVTTPIIDKLTFWERQKVAQKIGDNGLGEVLGRLERIKSDKDSTTKNRTRLSVIGNGMGGAAIYQSLAQIFKTRFIQTVTPEGMQGDIAGFGNLVILINPTLSALQFSSLSDMAAARNGYFGSQLPVLAVLASETDYVNKNLFPFGRSLNSMCQEKREIKRWNAMTRKNEIIDESVTNINALGNFAPYETHYLHQSQDTLITDQTKLAENFYKVYRAWVLDYPKSQIAFNGSVLERTNYSAGRNPYLVTQVSRDLINSHDDLSNERILEFIKELIMIASQTPKMVEKIRYEINPLGH